MNSQERTMKARARSAFWAGFSSAFALMPAKPYRVVIRRAKVSAEQALSHDLRKIGRDFQIALSKETFDDSGSGESAPLANR